MDLLRIANLKIANQLTILRLAILCYPMKRDILYNAIGTGAEKKIPKILPALAGSFAHVHACLDCPYLSGREQRPAIPTISLIQVALLKQSHMLANFQLSSCFVF